MACKRSDRPDFVDCVYLRCILRLLHTKCTHFSWFRARSVSIPVPKDESSSLLKDCTHAASMLTVRVRAVVFTLSTLHKRYWRDFV